jgi:hypothetical protein
VGSGVLGIDCDTPHYFYHFPTENSHSDAPIPLHNEPLAGNFMSLNSNVYNNEDYHSPDNEDNIDNNDNSGNNNSEDENT